MRTVFTTGGSSRLQLYVITSDGRGETVRFEPPVLFGNVGKSTYATCDDKIAQAIKQHPYFGSIVFLKSEESDSEKPAKQNDEPINYEAMCNSDKPIVVVEEVTSVATATHWLQSNHSAVWSSRKVESIKAEAAAKYNTIFPNL